MNALYTAIFTLITDSRGVNMSKKEYLALILSLLRPDEIKLSAANPTQYMTKTHVLLHYVALRRLGINL